MKLRKKIKRFWTLDVHGHEGFTLVELIIVIAILAILSSVAVVGYSSYVEKANKQADKTMIAEIKNALQLAYYTKDFDGTAAVVLQAGKPATIKGGSDAAYNWIDDALKAAYGDGYESALQLKYNAWGDGAAVAQKVLDYFSTVDINNALHGIYNGTLVPSFADEVDDLFVLVKNTATWVGNGLEMSGAALVQDAALLTAKGTITADQFAEEWRSSAWDNNFLMGSDGGSYGADVTTSLDGKDDALKNAVANAGVLKGRNISIASYLSNNGYPELYSIFANFNYAGTSIPADSAAFILTNLKNTEDGQKLWTNITTAIMGENPDNLSDPEFEAAETRLGNVVTCLNGYFGDETSQAHTDALAYFAMMDTVNNVPVDANDDTYWDNMENAVNLYGSIARGETTLAELNTIYGALNGITDDAVVITVMAQNGTLIISDSTSAANSKE